MSRDILLFGAPGAGKGTQAHAIAKTTGLPHIATGDMFRAHMQNGTELGLEAKRYYDRGELVPDEITIGMLRERLSRPDAQEGFLLDGFPRNQAQAEALDAMLAEQGRRIGTVLLLEVPVDELVRRITGRLVCRAKSHPYHVTDAPPKVEGVCDIDGSELYRRKDDDEETVRRRYAIYEKDTAPVGDHYRAKAGARVVEIDGARSQKTVEADLLAAIAAAPSPVSR
jgi:adenylate kinase